MGGPRNLRREIKTQNSFLFFRIHIKFIHLLNNNQIKPRALKKMLILVSSFVLMDLFILHLFPRHCSIFRLYQRVILFTAKKVYRCIWMYVFCLSCCSVQMTGKEIDGLENIIFLQNMFICLLFNVISRQGSLLWQ